MVATHITAARFALACLLAVGLPVLGAAPAGAAGPDRYLEAIRGLDADLRTAIERGPEGLLKSVSASERVCELGVGADSRGDVAAAAAHWLTLEQLVERFDRPGLTRVERAFAAASATLGEIEARFGRAWRRQGERLRSLRAAAADVRRGIRLVLAALGPLRAAFSAWLEHRCDTALAASEGSNRRARDGVAVIARGFERLWMLPIQIDETDRRDACRRAARAHRRMEARKVPGDRSQCP